MNIQGKRASSFDLSQEQLDIQGPERAGIITSRSRGAPLPDLKDNWIFPESGVEPINECEHSSHSTAGLLSVV